MKRSDLSDEQNRLMDTAQAYYWAQRADNVGMAAGSELARRGAVAAREAFGEALSATPIGEIAGLIYFVPREDDR